MITQRFYNNCYPIHPVEILPVIQKMDYDVDSLRQAGVSERHLKEPNAILQDRLKYLGPNRHVYLSDTLSHVFQFSPVVRTVLDVGCGYGEYMALLRGMNYDVYGINGTEYVDDFLYANKRLKLKVIQADLVKPLPFADKAFDCVFSCGVLTLRGLLPHIKSIVAELNRVAKWYVCLRLHQKMVDFDIRELAGDYPIIHSCPQDLAYRLK